MHALLLRTQALSDHACPARRKQQSASLCAITAPFITQAPAQARVSDAASSGAVLSDHQDEDDGGDGDEGDPERDPEDEV